MNDTIPDYAVIGSTPMARLLAGLLAGAHGKQVIHVGESVSSYRLPRGIDLSTAVLTRPESWSLLLQGIEEIQKLLRRIGGRGTWTYVNPIFFADGARAVEALSHMGHMARAFGVAAEPVPTSLLGNGRTGLTLRDAMRFNRAQLEPAIDTWLDRQGVRRLIPDKVTVRSDGSTSLQLSGDVIEAKQAILADDAAIIAHLPLPQWPRLLRRQQNSTILTTPTRPLASPVMLEIASGSMLLQQGEGGIAGIGPNDLASFASHMHALLGRERQVEQAGQTSFQALITADGAPAVGRASGVGADVVTGFGSIGPFLAPSVARWIAGTAARDEDAWLGARLINRSAENSTVGDYAPVGRKAP